jgi:hypothetical protein
VKRLAPLTLALLVLPTVASAAGSSRDEQERLNRADMALAKRAVVHKGDLVPGWRRVPSPPEKPGDDQCSGYDPDFSAFTITGKAHSTFAHGGGARIVGSVDVFPNATQAAGDFKAGAKPGLMRCLRRSLLQGLREAHLTARIVSSRMASTPRIGAQSVFYRVVARISPGSGRARFNVYADVLVFRQGRSIEALMFMSAFAPISNEAVLARSVARRMP